MSRRLPTWYALAGLCMGLFDLGLLRLMGGEILWQGSDVSELVGLAYGVTFAALGWVIGTLRLARRDLVDAQARLVQAEKMAALGRLSAGVAHEVRNPLGVLRASASYVLEEPGISEEVRRSAGFIRDEVDRLDHLVTQLLDFSRPLTPDRVSVEPASLIDAAVTLAGLDHVPVDGSARPVRVDPDLLTQALLGLLLNAGAAADHVGVRIRPSSWRWPTTDPASTPTCTTRSSSPSSPPAPRAPASACRWPPASPRPTGARSPSCPAPDWARKDAAPASACR